MAYMSSEGESIGSPTPHPLGSVMQAMVTPGVNESSNLYTADAYDTGLASEFGDCTRCPCKAKT